MEELAKDVAVSAGFGAFLGAAVQKVPLVGPALVVGSGVYNGYSRIEDGESKYAVIKEEAMRTVSTAGVCGVSQWVGGVIGSFGGPVGTIAGVTAGGVLCGALSERVGDATVNIVSQKD